MISLGKAKFEQGITDKEYERQRNALIPEAEKYANKECDAEGKMEKKKWTEKWNHYFHTKMNQLWKEKKEKGK